MSASPRRRIGFDSLSGGEDRDLLIPSKGHDLVDGGPGRDTVGSRFADPLLGDARSNRIAGLSGAGSDKLVARGRG